MAAQRSSVYDVRRVSEDDKVRMRLVRAGAANASGSIASGRRCSVYVREFSDTRLRPERQGSVSKDGRNGWRCEGSWKASSILLREEKKTPRVGGVSSYPKEMRSDQLIDEHTEQKGFDVMEGGRR